MKITLLRKFPSAAAVMILVGMVPPALAARAASGVFVPSQDGVFDTVVEAGPVTCARKNANKPYVPVRRMAKGKVQPLSKYISELRKQVKELGRTSRRGKRIANKLAKAKALNREALSLCNQGPGGTSPVAPIANAGSSSGVGLEPVALTLSVQSVLPGVPVTCEVVELPDSLTLIEQQGCNIAVRPNSHRISNGVISFRAFSPSNGLRSDPASHSVTWLQTGAFIGDSTSLAVYKDSLTRSEAAYLVRWAGMGAKWDELIELAQQPGGLDAVVEQLITPDSSANCDAVEEAAMAISAPSRALPRMDIDLDQDPNVSTVTTFTKSPDSPENRSIWSTTALQQYWLYMLVNGCNPLRERLGLLWHNHFSVNLDSIALSDPRRHTLKRHSDWLRGNVAERGNSNFLRIDRLVAWMHGADLPMLVWLNNNANAYGSAGGNENYARELMELFTLGPKDTITGAPNYSEQNIYDMRFALMGYEQTGGTTSLKIDDTMYGCCNPSAGGTNGTNCTNLPVQDRCRSDLDEFEVESQFFPSRWNALTQPAGAFLFQGFPWGRFDVFKANVLGASGDLGRSTHVVGGVLQQSGRHLPPNFDPAQDNLTPYLMYEHPGSARFIASRLITTFSTLELSESLVGPVAQSLIDNQYDPTEALRMILSSSAFFAGANQGDSISNPLVRFVSFARIFGLPLLRTTNSSSLESARNFTLTVGFPLTMMPTVFGVPEAGKIVGNSVKTGTAFLSTQAYVQNHRYFNDFLNEVDDGIDDAVTSFTWISILPNIDWQNVAPQDRPTEDEVLDHLLFKIGIEVTEDQRELLLEYLTTISTFSVTEDSLTVPDPERLYQVDWNDASMTWDKFNTYWELKAPGMLTLLWSLAQTNDL